MTNDDQKARRARHQAILAQVADEEAEAGEAEALERRGALEVPIHLRIDRELDRYLRERATTEGIPTSALVRRILRAAAHDEHTTGLSASEVEIIARRVAHEEIDTRLQTTRR